MLPVTGDVCASDQVGFMGSRSPIKVKASFVVAILTDLAECKRFLTLFQRRTDSPGHDHDQVALAIGEYVAVATGNAPIAITIEATQRAGQGIYGVEHDFEVRPLVHLRAAFRRCGLNL
jgi:hypothetical protein